MISRVFCREQIARLTQLRGYPKRTENSDPTEVKAALSELLDALQIAETEDIAKSVIDGFVHEWRECPVPADIRRACHAANGARGREYAIKPTNCSRCGDTGWQIVHRVVGSETYDFAVQCTHTEVSA